MRLTVRRRGSIRPRRDPTIRLVKLRAEAFDLAADALTATHLDKCAAAWGVCCAHDAGRAGSRGSTLHVMATAATNSR